MRTGPRADRVKVGLLLNQEEQPDVATPRWGDIRTMALQAEAIGIDSLWLVDHFLWPADPWGRPGAALRSGAAAATPALGVWECWTLLGALAEATSGVELGTLVTCTGYRNPALLAKMAEGIEEVSGGRLILGLGAGDNEFEHRMFGYEWERRVARFEDALRIVVPLLRSGSVDYHGEFYSANECRLEPRGPRPGGPPILIGSLATRPRVLRLVAQFADIWNAWGVRSAGDVPDLRRAVDEACETHGRDPATLRRSAVVAVAASGPMARAPGVLAGDAAAVADELLAFGAEGIEMLQLFLFPTEPRSLDFLGRVFARMGR